MQIIKNEIGVKFTLREAQSLLVILRYISNVNRASIALRGIPLGVLDDARNLQMELEVALLMNEKPNI